MISLLLGESRQRDSIEDHGSQRVDARVRGHLPVLDGLRGVAILLVLLHNAALFHVRASSHLLKAMYFLHAPGWIGVQLFFVISGFLITGVLLDSDGPGVLRSFWIRRALRIFPLYFTSLFLLTVVVPPLCSWHEFQTRGEAWWYWTYLCNWGQAHGHEIPALAHFWSLAVEEQFYLLWPLIVLALDRRDLLRLSLLLAVVALVLRIVLRAEGMADAVYKYTFTRMDALSLGAAAAVVVRDRALLAIVARYLRPILAGASSMLVLMWPITRGFNVYDPLVQTVGYAALSVLFAALVLLTVVDEGAALAGWLSAPWLRWIGKYSYGIYVVHLPIATMVAPWFAPTMNGVAALPAIASLIALEICVAALSVAAALLSWLLLERRALALKDRWAPRVSRPPFLSVPLPASDVNPN